jgi:hypothetical protein
MYELIYRSIAASNITNVDVKNILNTSRKFNSENNITGCLLFHNKEFIQILEGDEVKVKELYARIEQDKRHSNVSLVLEGIKESRMFSGWSMAYHELENTDIDDINKLLFENNIKTFAELTEDRSEAVKLFWYMAKQLMEDKE